MPLPKINKSLNRLYDEHIIRDITITEEELIKILNTFFTRKIVDINRRVNTQNYSDDCILTFDKLTHNNSNNTIREDERLPDIISDSYVTSIGAELNASLYRTGRTEHETNSEIERFTESLRTIPYTTNIVNTNRGNMRRYVFSTYSCLNEVGIPISATVYTNEDGEYIVELPVSEEPTSYLWSTLTTT